MKKRVVTKKQTRQPNKHKTTETAERYTQRNARSSMQSAPQFRSYANERQSPQGMRAAKSSPSGMQRTGTRKKAAKTVSGDIRERHKRNLRKRRRNRNILRSLFLLIVLGITVFALVFMTPIFNITSVNLVKTNTQADGSEFLDGQAVIDAAAITVGENMFKTDLKFSKKQIENLPYADNVVVKRKLFPKPHIEIRVGESERFAQIQEMNQYVCIDKNMKVLEFDSVPFENVVTVKEINIVKSEISKKLEIDESDKFDIIRVYMYELKENDLLKSVSYISYDTSSRKIIFDYGDKLTVEIVDSLNYKRNLLHLKRVLEQEMDKNAVGTIEISVDGYAVYKP